VNDQVLVGVLDGSADVAEEREPGRSVEPLEIAIVDHRLPFEVRLATYSRQAGVLPSAAPSGGRPADRAPGRASIAFPAPTRPRYALPGVSW